jgi:type I restriction enzyme, S subunit
MNGIEKKELNLPNNWIWTNVGQISEEIEKISPRDEPEKEFKYLDIASIDNKYLMIVDHKNYKGRDAPSRARQLVKTGDILFSTVRTYLRNIAIIDDVYNGQIASTGFCVIRPNKLISNKMIFYYTQTNSFLNSLNPKQRGTSYPAVRNSDVFSQPFPLAPLAEQYRIVARIEELFSRLDAGVEALQKVKAQLQRYRQSVLKAAVEGRLTEEWRKEHPEVEPAREQINSISEDMIGDYAEIDNSLFDLPDSWTWTTLGNLISEGPQNGLYLPQSSYGTGFPILRIDDFQDNCSRSSNQFRLVNANVEDLEKYSLKNGDLVINRVNSPSHLGKCLLVSARNLPAIFESNMMRMKLSQLTDTQFVVIYLRSLFGKRQITKNAKWAVNQASINQKDVSNTFVPYPSLAEQQVISEKVDGYLSLSYHVGNSIDDEIKRANRLRQSILKGAFEGRLVPQNPNDEPASVLLERIKAERANGSPKRGRKSSINTNQMRLIQ